MVKRSLPAAASRPATFSTELTSQSQKHVVEPTKIRSEDHDDMEVDIEGTEDEAISVTDLDKQNTDIATNQMVDGDNTNEDTFQYDCFTSSLPSEPQLGSNLSHHL